jgi:PEP-CTERM motif-containing protein
MRFHHTLITLTAVLTLLSLAVAPTHANSIPTRGASAYGGNDGFTGCENEILDLLNKGNQHNCEGFTAGTFAIGGNTYNGDEFVFLEEDGSFGVLDILRLSGPSLSLTMNSALTPTGVFMCGSKDDKTDPAPSVAQSSTPEAMPTLLCTAGTNSDPNNFSDTQDVSGVQATFTLNGVTFVNGNSAELTVFAQDGSIVGSTFTPGGATMNAPEPSSLTLFGVGLLALGRKFRRVRRAV